MTLVSFVRVVEHRRRLLYRARYMTWLDKLEKRFGFIAIPGLIRAVVLFNVLVLGLVWLNPSFSSVIDLNPSRILHGEVWRLVTYIFIPQTFSWWVVLFLWFLWFIGDGLERAWGAFRLTLYFFVGMIGTTIAAFFFGSNFSNSMLISSLFFAFARFYPDVVIYLFFILPVKIKWLAWVLGGRFAGRICSRPERLSHGRDCGAEQLPDLFRPGDHSRCAPSPRSLEPPQAVRGRISQRDRVDPQVRGLRRDRS